MAETEGIEKIETITPAEAGKILGKNAEFVRAGLRQNRFPFGTAVESKSGQWNYIIIKSKFLEYVKWKEWEKMSEQMKKYCIAGKIVYFIKDYVLPICAIFATELICLAHIILK